MGPEVEELEAELGRLGGAPAVAVSNGSDALLIALLALGVGRTEGRRDAVFVPSFTFTATAEVVLLAGAVPVFVDVREEDFLLDLDSLRREFEALERTGNAVPRAVITVDLFGQPMAEHPLAEWAEARGLEMVSDAAQSFGARRGGRPVGSLAPVTTTSFYPAKPLGGYGDGGAVLCTEPAVEEVVRSIREHGQSADRYDIVRLGMNGRLDTLQAAVLLAKLTIFEQELAARRAVAAGYTERLGAASASMGTPWRVAAPECGAGVESSWAQYTLPSGRPGRQAVGADPGCVARPSRSRRHSDRGLLPAPDAPAAGLRALRPRAGIAAGERESGRPGGQPADAPLPRRVGAGSHLRSQSRTRSALPAGGVGGTRVALRGTRVALRGTRRGVDAPARLGSGGVSSQVA